MARLGLVALAAGAATAAAAGPEQIHISLTGDPTSIAVDFVASSSGQLVNVTETGQSTPADCRHATLNTYSAYFCTGVLTGLAANTKYTYSVGSDASGWSKPVAFTNQPSDRSPIFAVYADFGYDNDESLAALIKDSDAGGFDYVIHAGDHAYDLDSSNSKVGNDFVNSIQPYASKNPYMATVGNHEAYGTQGGGEFAQYVMRYRALGQYAGAASGSNSPLWYSFETPLIHWIAFAGETWTMNATQLAQQSAWLTADVAKIDRTKTPWVVAFSHKSWQMDQTTRSLYDFLVDNRVDLQLVGHWHQYTRFPPMDTRGTGDPVVDYQSMSGKGNTTYTNAKYPAVIVMGAPGDRELNPRNCSEAYNVVCNGNYGYGKLQAINATHLHWTWSTTVPVKGGPDPTFGDDLWVVKYA